jgi:putative transposase
MRGLLLQALVTPADIQDRDGGIALLSTLFGLFPFLDKLFADSAYQGPVFHTALASILPNLETEIVKRSDDGRTDVAVWPRTGKISTLAGSSFLRLASIRLMLRKLCNST